MNRTCWTVLAAVATLAASAAADSPLETGQFKWRSSPVLVTPKDPPGDHFYSVKDPSIVRHDGRWHLFSTIRGEQRSHQVEYRSFAEWNDADKAEPHLLNIVPGYYCAPQVFYFRPQKKWYLIYQTADASRKPQLQPAFSTNADVANPAGWSKPTLLFAQQPKNVTRWIDFWVICDDAEAHLFFTSLNGQMWRSDTKLADFPGGWDEPRIVLKGDVFEASHTYKLLGMDKYLTMIEAIGDSGRRYYKAYLADRLDGQWTPLAATRDKPFASNLNVTFDGDAWSDSFSHGELLRAGEDERLEVDPADLRLLYQGVSDADRQGKPYGQIPWRLGVLEPAR
jgi:Glycosyl hydrolase family 62